jgi:hypothetical protein
MPGGGLSTGTGTTGSGGVGSIIEMIPFINGLSPTFTIETVSLIYVMRADLLIVGNNLKRNVIDRVIKNLEAEIGRELAYAVMETGDFNYRLAACDKFIRDVLDYPHSVIIDKIGLRYP